MNDDVPTTDDGLFLALADELATGGATEAFRQRYRPLLLAWCRDHGLAEADADAVARDVLDRLVLSPRVSPGDPAVSYRTHLHDLVARAVADVPRTRALAPEAARSLVDDLSNHLIGEERLARAAARQVQTEVDPSAWSAFTRQAVDGRTAEETAAELGLPVAAVLKARSRVGKKLREAIDALRGGSTVTEGGAS